MMMMIVYARETPPHIRTAVGLSIHIYICMYVYICVCKYFPFVALQGNDSALGVVASPLRTDWRHLHRVLSLPLCTLVGERFGMTHNFLFIRASPLFLAGE